MRAFGVRLALVAAGGALLLGSECGKKSGRMFAEDPSRLISDAALVLLAKVPFDKAQMMHHRAVVGVHQGTPVRVEFPCSDQCPEYTTRVIRYDVPNDRCPAEHGVVMETAIPAGPALRTVPYCFPKALVRRGLVQAVPTGPAAGAAPQVPGAGAQAPGAAAPGSAPPSPGTPSAGSAPPVAAPRP